MKDENSPRKGIVPLENENIVFYGDKYHFSFMRNRLDPNKDLSIKCNDEYIYGETYDNRKIAIYAGCDSLPTYVELDAFAYVIFRDKDVSKYKCIEFVGGTLNKLLKPISYDTITFDINKNGIKKIVVGKKDCDPPTNDIFMRISFDDEKDLSSLIDIYFNAIKIVSYMVNRRNVGFAKIVLKNSCPESEEFISKLGELTPEIDDIFENVADVYINLYEPLTEKEKHRCIWFSEMGESFVNLVNYLFDKNCEKQLLDLSVIPENDADANLITRTLVKDIFASLENEYNRSIKSPKNPDKAIIKELRKELKNIIKAYKSKMSDKRNIGFLNRFDINFALTATEKIEDLFNKYRTLLQSVVNDSAGGLSIEKDDFSIDETRAFRNGSTHDGPRPLNKTITNTTYILRILAYCSFWTRLGMKKEEIEGILFKYYYK